MNTPDSPSQEGVLTSGEHLSYWTSSVPPMLFQPLKEDVETEVLVVGGGLGGLTTAYCLLQAGKKVVVLEDGEIGSGESGRTTAHITYALDDRYYFLEQQFGQEGARMLGESHRAAIDWIDATVAKEGIDCHFRRVEGYLFLHPSDKPENLDRELEATQRLGLPTEMVPKIPGLPAGDGRAIRFPGNGQFHIMEYMNGLARAIVKSGGRIFTRSRAEEISKEGAKSNGHTVKAKHIVVATNSPVNDWVQMHSKQAPYRTYAIGALVQKGSLPYALWWDTGNTQTPWEAEPYHYVRVTPYNDQYDLLISGGEDHKTGQAESEHIPEERRYDALTEWTRKQFPGVQAIVHRWSGQVLEPIDGAAFLGRNPGDGNVYIITGDSGNGMTHCTIGGLLITDLILGRENPWAKLYDPSRIPVRAARVFIKENLNVAAQYVDLITGGDVSSLDGVRPGQGAILSKGLKKYAVYRDEAGRVHSFSAICPHLQAVLHWNADEKSFDCPVHGSRFTKEGKLVNGPAIGDLEQKPVE